jgi:hypothetical protein
MDIAARRIKHRRTRSAKLRHTIRSVGIEIEDAEVFAELSVALGVSRRSAKRTWLGLDDVPDWLVEAVLLAAAYVGERPHAGAQAFWKIVHIEAYDAKFEIENGMTRESFAADAIDCCEEG